MKALPAMIPSERPAAPEIDSVALATTIAAYQRSRRLLNALQAERPARETAADSVRADQRSDAASNAHRELIHERTRIARARLRSVIGNAVFDAVHAHLPKASLVRRINDQVNGLVREGAIEPDGPILAEIIEWIVERYPSDLLDSVSGGARPTPPHSRDIIPLQLIRSARADASA
jgi:hypothetical protein